MGIWLAVALSLSGVSERQAFLQESLDAGAGPAATWWYGWTLGYSALTLGQGVGAALVSERRTRANLVVGAAGSLIGALALLAMPLPAVGAGDAMRAAGDDDAQTALGEVLLRDSAEAEAFGQSVLAHVLCFVVSAAQGLVLWLAYDEPTDGLLSGILSMALGEAQILTQPTRAIDDLRAYEERFAPHVGATLIPGGAALYVSY